EGDKGKNTGGMGAYAPAPIVDDELKNKVEHLIIKPVLKAMSDSGNPYKGCLYVGLMIDKGNPKVVEFNARFGDPETQAVMQLVKGDVAKLFYSAAIGKLDKSCIEIDDKSSCVCIVLASNGYPDKFDKGFVIDFPKEVKDNQYIYHAGTKKLNGDIITNGGRVLGVTAIADTMHEAVKSAYELVDDIKYENKYFRNDIAHKAL
ncbi:MAG: phosphoribosylglycinamide synthetase C domain-containing protein, partial [Candidatus Kapabacteria bacterium]|nr:phosphoribosylglycinamide synthetase C domain-containing protein [Candidatus Kapabacteria bacterium]